MGKGKRSFLRGKDVEMLKDVSRSVPLIEKVEDTMPDKPPIKKFAFGTCAFASTSPERNKGLTGNTKILNVQITFEEALKLNLAIDECVRKLNSYKRSTRAGKSMGLNLAIHLEAYRITVNEEKVVP